MFVVVIAGATVSIIILILERIFLCIKKRHK
jgi:hypothetical protein